MTYPKGINADMISEFLTNESEMGSMYHKKHGYRMVYKGDRKRPFLFWDGEGITHKDMQGGSAEQSYVLFGHSGDEFIESYRLRTEECLEFMLEQSVKHKGAHHVGFSFEYDVNMILANLPRKHFALLRKNGRVKWGRYSIEHVPRKWFGVSDGERSIRISDVFGFFQCSFVKAIESYIPQSPYMAQLSLIKEGKSARSTFTWEEMEFVKQYWGIENKLGQELVEQLREYLWEVDFKVNQWHGPGALANYVYRHNDIQQHKPQPPTEVSDAAAFAYAGGRFEMFNIGRFQNVYSIDINSAYPTAIAQLPSLSPEHGFWHPVEYVDPNNIAEFGVYRVIIRPNPTMPRLRAAGPIFHRDAKSNITFPWQSVGWYWSPEIKQLLSVRPHDTIQFLEGWEWISDGTKPFAGFVPEYYYERKAMKSRGQGAEKALKLVLNSLYGKMAQRVGWERTKGAPTWHRLEWAGWVTSFTRATLFEVMKRIPIDQLLAVETDGIYTTVDPATLGIFNSGELGGWEVSYYDEFMYLQSGIYAGLHPDKGWITKYRGLDSGTLSEKTMATYLQSCQARQQWQPITGPTTRFVGYGAALMAKEFSDKHNHWITTDKELKIGTVGKRIHQPKFCLSCRMGVSPYERPHSMIINSVTSKKDENLVSQKHFIPWEDEYDFAATSRNVAAIDRELIRI